MLEISLRHAFPGGFRLDLALVHFFILLLLFIMFAPTQAAVACLPPLQ